jgi:hypothetical protein
MLEEFPEGDAREKLTHAWHDVAVRLYRNWLMAMVAEHKADGLLAAGSSLPATAQ